MKVAMKRWAVWCCSPSSSSPWRSCCPPGGCRRAGRSSGHCCGWQSWSSVGSFWRSWPSPLSGGRGGKSTRQTKRRWKKKILSFHFHVCWFFSGLSRSSSAATVCTLLNMFHFKLGPLRFLMDVFWHLYNNNAPANFFMIQHLPYIISYPSLFVTSCKQGLKLKEKYWKHFFKKVIDHYCNSYDTVILFVLFWYFYIFYLLIKIYNYYLVFYFFCFVVWRSSSTPSSGRQ